MFMMNSSRVEHLNYKWKIDLKKEIDNIDKIWEARKEQWLEHSKNCFTLEKYLKLKFYEKH